MTGRNGIVSRLIFAAVLLCAGMSLEKVAALGNPEAK